MLIRPFDPERDRQACYRIWREVGWLKAGEEPGMDLWVDSSRAFVAELNGEAECLVLATKANLRHLDSELPLSAITGVTTSLVGRKQGLAGRALARLVAEEARDGAHVSGLGMFEQGYYNRLGYGTTSYLQRIGFDPARLQIPIEARPPCRLGKEDWEEIHANRLGRRRIHGSVSLLPPASTRAECGGMESGFGLGYRDDAGRLTHHVWLYTSAVERGPYDVAWMAYRSLDELFELLALIHNLGDQVRLVRLTEPPGFVMQDLVSQPFKYRSISESGKFAANIHSFAPYQFRICDLPRCLASTRLTWGEVSFGLELHDPIDAFLSDDTGWRGCGGSYQVTLGRESYAEPGESSSLPTLRASIGTFTRLWMGARPASTLVHTDGLEAPPELVRQLDQLLRLPAPAPDWDF